MEVDFIIQTEGHGVGRIPRVVAIGVKRAKREELLAVEGVGARTADRIRWAVSDNQALYGYDPDPVMGTAFRR